MRVAHFSDLHILALEGVGRSRFLNKRFTGYVNLRFKREHKHRPAHLRAVAREVARVKADHVVITGDLTNLALEQEFDAVAALLEEELGIDGANITVVPGNHDLYTRGAMRTQRFTRSLAKYLESDLPELAASLPLGQFPVVKLRGPLAFIGLSSAVPRPPLVAAGELGRAQIEALARVLSHDEVKRRTPIFAFHHPIHNPASPMKTWAEGLRDADDLDDVLASVKHGLLLHGHLHRRHQRDFPTRVGNLVSVIATSASLHHDDEHRMAGFNLYETDGDGDLLGIEAHVLDPETGTFRIAKVPQYAA